MNNRLASLLPFPATVRPRAGSLPLGSRASVAAGPGAAGAAATVRRVLASWPWPGDAHGDGRPGDQSVREITVDIDPDRPDEGYRLITGPEQIRITAGGAVGAFYATQTLRQLLPEEAWRAAPVPGPAWSVPCAEIEDAPALAWRGAHLDVARHFFPKRELLTLIDSLAALKLNRLHLHLTDDQGWRMESLSHPALHEIGSHRRRSRVSLSKEQPAVYDDTPHGGYYTLADLAEVAAYAAQRMMTLVPEIDVPGHATALLAAVPELGAGWAESAGPLQVAVDWGIFPNLLSPLPETMTFLEAVFGELLDAIPARYIHIGGDECVLDSWRADPRVDARRLQLGLASAEEQHAHFLRETADLLADRFGVRAVVWDEGFASGSGTPRGRLRPDTVVMAWRGMDIARRAAQAGHDVIAAAVFPTYFDYSQADDDREPLAIGGPIRAQDVAAFRPAPPDWPAAAAEHLIGTQFQVWTEYIPDGRALEYMVFPRACALAEVAWAGGPAAWPGDPDGTTPPLRDRLVAHARRLDAAGVEYRPLDGPRPWQEGGAGPRRHRAGYRIADVMARLGGMAAAPGP